ncbi:MAG: transposase [Phormidium tanganyikae FI6-MK23]|jgi:hypothetical protein|nr:transposase [Phormidium tanganyikae FI6-MK23]
MASRLSYFFKMAKQLLNTAGIQLITKLKRTMKQRLMPLNDRLLLRKRAITETIIDQLKNISQIEHSRHRSPVNCFVNILGGLIAYCHQPKKPTIANTFRVAKLTTTICSFRLNPN